MRRAFVTCLGAAGLLSAELALGLAAGGCGDETAGERVVLETRAELAQTTFSTSLGWEITLTEATVAIGELRYFEGEPVTAWFGIRPAYAHPGHYQEGGTVGEMLEPVSVDLMASPVALPAGNGVTGTARSALFAADSVRVAGTAKQGATERTFFAVASPSEPVVGCTFANGEISGDGTVVVTVHAEVWLDQVDFALLPDSGELVPGEIPHKAFVRGLQKAAAYTFAYERKE